MNGLYYTYKKKHLQVAFSKGMQGVSKGKNLCASNPPPMKGRGKGGYVTSEK